MATQYPGTNPFEDPDYAEPGPGNGVESESYNGEVGEEDFTGPTTRPAKQDPDDLDFSRGELLPEGDYLLRLDAVEKRQGNAGPYLLWRAAVLEGQGGNVFIQLSLSPQSRFIVEQFLDAVGAPKEGKGNPKQFLKRVVVGKIYHDEYPKDSGTFRVKVQSVRRPSPEQMAAGKVAAAPSVTLTDMYQDDTPF